MSINNEIQNTSYRNNNQTNSIDTLESALFKAEKDAQEKINSIRQRNVTEQARLLAELESKGIEKNSEKYKKALENIQKEQAKNELKDKLNILNKTTKQYQKDSEKISKDFAKTALNISKDKSLDKETRQEAKDIVKQYKKQEQVEALQKSANDTLERGINDLVNIGTKLASTIDNAMENYTQYQSQVNTRLQGLGGEFGNTMDKYGKLTSNLMDKVGITPYIKTENLYRNLNELSNMGIAFNLEQRAFLETISDNIATTFSTTDATLLRLIKLQMQDSSAARLGMEASLNSFLNSMYENTEYLSRTFDNVTAALFEASSTMSTETAVSFEYAVQKWLGSMTSVGFSDESAQKLATAIGYLGSSDIDALTNSDMFNLLTVAASRIGEDIGNILNTGLTVETTNNLLESVVEYLKEISMGNNQLVQAQTASIFGVSLSDLKSLINLNTNTLTTVKNNSIDYSGAIQALAQSMSTIDDRLSVGTLMDTYWKNLEYSLGQNMAANPAMYATWKVTNLIKDYTGGINIPFVTALGNGVDVNTTVDNLMRLGLVGVSSFGMIGDLISGISNTADPSSFMSAMGLDKLATLTTIQRDTETGLMNRKSGLNKSGRTSYVANTSSSDVYNQSLTQISNQQEQLLQEAEDNRTTKSANEIYEYMVGDFSSSLHEDIFTVKNDIISYATTDLKPFLHLDMMSINDGLLAYLSSDFISTITSNIMELKNEFTTRADSSALALALMGDNLSTHNTTLLGHLTNISSSVVVANNDLETTSTMLKTISSDVSSITEMLRNVISNNELKVRVSNSNINSFGLDTSRNW